MRVRGEEVFKLEVSPFKGFSFQNKTGNVVLFCLTVATSVRNVEEAELRVALMLAFRSQHAQTQTRLCVHSHAAAMAQGM